MKKRTTIADVAQATGVSIMTVSRAINNKPGVSEELRQKILNVADEMDYHPSKIARGLALQRTGIIGLVVPSISNPFYAEIAQSVEDVAFENGYSVFLINTSGNLAREQAALDSLWGQNIDGAILCSLRLPEKKVVEFIQHLPAVVLFNRELEVPVPNVVTICVNDERAALEAVQHFFDQGRKHVAFISGPEDSYSGNRRLEGYRQAHQKAGIPFDPDLVMHIMPTTDEGREAAIELIARCPDVDAILAFNDMVAIGVIQACRETGKRVPEDIGIIGADDTLLATTIRPRLSTSRSNLAHIGRLAMRTLLDMFGEESISSSYEIQPQLIIRESG